MPSNTAFAAACALAALLAGTATAQDAVGVAMPEGVLTAPAAEAVPAPIEASAVDPLLAGPVVVPARYQRDAPDVLVGTPAWYATKFTNDPSMMSDHGAPMVVFVPEGPALP